MQYKVNMAQIFKVSLSNLLSHLSNESSGVCEAWVKAWDEQNATVWTKTPKWKLNETKWFLEMTI